jgi:phospholipid N-methyltransferase
VEIGSGRGVTHKRLSRYRLGDPIKTRGGYQTDFSKEIAREFWRDQIFSGTGIGAFANDGKVSTANESQDK